MYRLSCGCCVGGIVTQSTFMHAISHRCIMCFFTDSVLLLAKASELLMITIRPLYCRLQ